MKIKLGALLSSLLTLESFALDDKYCRTLALSGGGSNGAWEMGVLWGLTHYGTPSDFTWDVVTGISAGSINTVIFTGFEVG